MAKSIIIFTSIVLTFLVACSCSIIKKSKEVTRDKSEALAVVKSDIQTKTESSELSEFESHSENQLISLLSAINWNYSGKDSAEIEITKTESGIKIKTKGSGTADLKVKSETKTEKKDSVSHIKSHSYNSFEESVDKSVLTKSSSEKVQKDKDVKRVDISVWYWIVLLIIALTSLTYWWFFGRPRI